MEQGDIRLTRSRTIPRPTLLGVLPPLRAQAQAPAEVDLVWPLVAGPQHLSISQYHHSARFKNII